ncbi:MAG: LamG domain-containing protein, partial [Holophagales bacterium]|nr:LamG domain-containing protein [Holophagales bacterium]
AQGGWFWIVDKRGAGADGFALYRETGRRAFVRINQQTLTGTTIVADDAWHHLVGVYDGGEIRIYVDGVLDASAPSSAGTVETTADLLLGRNYSSGNFFRGTLDDVRLYDRALDAAEIADLFDVPPPARSNEQPTGALLAGTTQADVTLDTDEAATCRWSLSAGIGFDSMAGTFDVSGGTSHSHTATGLADGESYTFFVRCRDTAGNTNTDDLAIPFEVAAPPDLSTDLQGHWSLDDGSGTSAADSSGLGNHGTVTGGAAWTSGQVAGALSFDGVDDGMTVAHTPGLGALSAVSITAWIRVDPADGGAWQSIVDKRDGNLDGYDLYLASSDQLFMRVNDQTLQGVAALDDGLWHHVAGVYDGSTIRLYVDGTLEKSATVGAETISTSATLHLGQNWQGGSFLLTGQLDDVRVYSRALSAPEIATLASP